MTFSDCPAKLPSTVIRQNPVEPYFSTQIYYCHFDGTFGRTQFRSNFFSDSHTVYVLMYAIPCCSPSKNFVRSLTRYPSRLVTQGVHRKYALYIYKYMYTPVYNEIVLFFQFRHTKSKSTTSTSNLWTEVWFP